MKEIRLTWAEILLFLIGAGTAVYRIITDIVSYTGMQLMLLEYDPGTPAYAEHSSGLIYPLIDGGVCIFILLALIIVMLIKLLYKGGKNKKPSSHEPLIKTTNASAPAGKGFTLSNPEGSIPPMGICPECGARIFRYEKHRGAGTSEKTTEKDDAADTD